MAKKLRIALMLTVFTLLAGQKAKADHIVGMDITYKCVQDSVFKVVLNFYRDCNGCYVLGQSPRCGTSENCNSSQTAPTSLTVSSFDGCGFSTTLSMTRTAIIDITKTCASDRSRCAQPCNGSFPYGIEKHVFEGTLDLRKPMRQGCCNFRISMTLFVRSVIITTGQSGNGFSTFADIYACRAPCNNSPTLANDPVALTCCEQPFTFNNGAIDTADFDSLSFGLAPAFQSSSTQTNYKSPYNYKYPVPVYQRPGFPNRTNPNAKPPEGFYCDTTSGDLIFTPSGDCPWVGIVVMEIKEWRKDKNGKWQVIGVTRRDMQFIAYNCGPNNPPKIDATKYAWDVCEGDKLCFKINGTDDPFTPYQTQSDTVDMKWNGGIPGATFTELSKKGGRTESEFCWQTKVGQGSDIGYAFTVTAADRVCPKPATAIKSFKVRVKRKAFGDRFYDTLKCGKVAFRVDLPSNFRGSGTFRWSIRDSVENELFYRTKQKDTVTFKYGGKKIFVLTLNNSDNCPTIYRDTIEVPDPPRVNLAITDTFACYNTTIRLVPTVVNAANPLKYYWTRPNVHTAGDTLSELSISGIDRDSTIVVRVKDADGCFAYDTVVIYLKPLPEVDAGPDARICTYQNFTFDAQHADTTKYLWLPDNDTTRTITKNRAGKYIAQVIDKKWGCIGRDTVELFVNDTVISLAGQDRTICNRDSVTLDAKHQPANRTAQYEWSNVTSGSAIGQNAKYKIRPLNTNPNGGAAQFIEYALYTRVTQSGVTCEDKDTFRLRINSLPNIGWSKKPRLDDRCYDYGDIVLSSFINPANSRIWAKTAGMVDSVSPTRYLFKTSKLNNASLQGGKSYSERLYASFRDTNGCLNVDSTIQRINGNPQVTLRTRVYCQDKGEAPLDSNVVVPKSKSGINYGWRAIGAPSGIDPSSVVVDKGVFGNPNYWLQFGSPTEDYYAGTYTLEYCVTDVITQCRTCDTTTVLISTEPKLKLNSPGAQCLNWDTLDLLNYVTVDGLKPARQDGVFKFVSFNGDRTAPEVSTSLISGHIFNPAFGVGDWEILYVHTATGCSIKDSFTISVKALPNITLNPGFTVCSNAAPVNLSTLINQVTPLGGTGNWSGPGKEVGADRFLPNFKGTQTATTEGPYFMKYAYTESNGCQDEDSVALYVRSLPNVTINGQRPLSGCERTPFNIAATTQFDNGVIWETILGSDGTFDNSGSKTINYTHGTQDGTNGSAWVRVRTLPLTNEVCPQARDSVQIIIHPYPIIEMSRKVTGCAPLVVNFTSVEKKGIPAGQLTYNWNFGNSTTSTDKDPLGIGFPNQGIYNVGLTVTNTSGPCATTIDSIGHVQVFPVPVASFTTDPNSTTVALPKFRFNNQSTLDKSVFTNGYNRYIWNFGTGISSDTSHAENPSFAYGKDTATYTVTLLVTSDKGCTATAVRRVYVGPDIIVYIPDAFTPDAAGDPRNNVFTITASNYKSLNMKIYNRWGEKLFETNDIGKGWDGKFNGAEVQQDVYVYHVEITSFDGKIYKFDGTLTLLR